MVNPESTSTASWDSETAAEASRLCADLVAGRPRALARALSWVENQAPQAGAVLERVYGMAPREWIIGITGVGGAGKSTLVPHLARLLAEQGCRVAVLAVDPSSPITGGALLGDRIRDAAGRPHPGIYFRSVASRGGQGGLATCVADLARVAGAAGHDVVLIETVGAGQSELAVLEVAQTVVLVGAPGLGDDVQAQKAGLMEVADVLVLNKADRPGADDALESLRQAVRLDDARAHLQDGLNETAAGQWTWMPPALPTVALAGTGVDQLLQRLLEHRDFLGRSGRLDALRHRQALQRLHTRLMEIVRLRVQQRLASMDEAAARMQELARGGNPLTAAARLADALLPGSPADGSPAPQPAFVE